MMNQADIFKKIGAIVNELQDQYEFLAHNPEQLNELELELFLANANFLSDHVEIIRKLNTVKVTKELPQRTEISRNETEQIPAKPPVSEQVPVVDDLPESKDYTFFEKPADLVEYVSEETAPITQTFEFILNDRIETDQFDFEEKPVDAIFDRPLSAEETRIIAEKQRIREEQARQAEARENLSRIADPAATQDYRTTLVPDRVEEKEVSAPSTLFVQEKIEQKTVTPPTPVPSQSNFVQFNAEPNPEPALFREEPKPQAVAAPDKNAPKLTINDLLANKNSGGTAQPDESVKAPILDLKSGITLNEKLLYIKDLFNGYNLAYSEAIDLINKMPDLKTADAFLKNNYAEKNNWQAKQNTVDQFYALLNQRFPNG